MAGTAGETALYWPISSILFEAQTHRTRKFIGRRSPLQTCTGSMPNMSCEMNESEQRPSVFVAGLIQPGDVVLTTTPERVSQVIRKVTGADISHAMICVGKPSVSDSTGDGVHARNLERLILEPGCGGHVLRPVKQLTTDQLHSVVSFARAAVDTRYSMTGAAKSVLAGFVAGRRQFCSRLVAQAYRNAGVNIVSDADFCHPQTSRCLDDPLRHPSIENHG